MNLIYEGKVASARSYIVKRKVWHNVMITKWGDIMWSKGPKHGSEIQGKGHDSMSGSKGEGATGPMERPGSAVPGVSSKGANLLASLGSSRSILV